MTSPFVQQPLNTPSKPQVVGAARGRNQKDRRYNDTFWDLHKSARFPRGRPWCGPREIAANRDGATILPEDGFCIPDLMQGEYVELEDGSCDREATMRSAWTAPWVPIAKYFKFQYKRKLITFDYAGMKLHEDQGIDRYFRAAAKLGIQLNIRVERGVIPHPMIVAELGEPSRLNKIAEAAMAGDPWLLGHIDEPNPVLAEILGYHQSGLQVITSYEPPPMQAPRVEAVIAAPPNTDLLALLMEMQKGMMAMQQQVTDLTAKKTKKVDAMAKARAARHQSSPAA